MNTECSAGQLEFHGLGRRAVVGKFDGGKISSDSGGLLLREVEQRTHILKRLAGCFTDHRDAELIEHSLESLLMQRVMGLALGYKVHSDHNTLRHDPLLALLSDKQDLSGKARKRDQDKGCALAGKSTLNRLELTPLDADAASRYKKIVADPGAMDDLLVDLFLEAYDTPPKRSFWMSMRPMIYCMEIRKAGSFTVTIAVIATCLCIYFVTNICCVRVCAQPTRTGQRGR